MMIKLLDCTLRDGGHVNSALFGEACIKNIVKTLIDVGMDFIELGFLKSVNYSVNTALFPKLEDAYRFLPKEDCNVDFSLMVRSDVFNVKGLSECTGRIKIIRIAFYYNDLDGAILWGQEAKAKGFDVIFNPVNIMGYTKDELLIMLDKLNCVSPYAITIVDTFGSMMPEDLESIFPLFNEHFYDNGKIGFHPHDNLCMAFSLAQEFIRLSENTKREVIIDASLMGMGRLPGNLPVELIADYLNNRKASCYKTQLLSKVIGEEIIPMKQEYKWGYSPAYFISARNNVHRSYAEHLEKKELSLHMIDKVISSIPQEKAGRFDREFVETLVTDVIKDYV